MSISQSIGPHLPLLRRYARALTGNQERGDRYVAASLEAILQAPNEFPRNTTPRVGLYQIFQKIWSASQAPFEAPAHDDNGDGDGREAIAQRRLAALTPRSRQALPLTAMEGFSRDEAAAILEADEEEIAGLLARSEEHTSELQSLMRHSNSVFCLKKTTSTA